MKYIKRTNKKLRKEILNMALKEELLFLKRKCFPYKRVDFLMDDLEVKERDFSLEKDNIDTLGMYEYDLKNFKHIIYIHKRYLVACHKSERFYDRKYCYERVKSILRHELIHAFVEEKWERKGKRYITDKNNDASPIFLAVLYWVGSYTSHNCLKGFKNTEVYKRICNNDFKTYEDLRIYLCEYLYEYMEAINQINSADKNRNQDKNNIVVINNAFKFAPRSNGLEKYFETKSSDIYKENKTFRKIEIITRTWNIGCNVSPYKLLELYDRKQDCVARYYHNKKQYLTIPATQEIKVENLKIIKAKEDKNY